MPYIQRVTIGKPCEEKAKSFPFNIEVIKNGLEIKFDKAVTILAGENASGKSTLLESLAVAAGYPKQGGFRGQNMARKNWGLNHYGETIEVDHDNIELSEHLRIQYAQKPQRGYFFRSEYMSETLQLHLFGKRLMTQSHGEGILELIQTQFKDGLFILDEPESALSPTSLLALVSMIHENAKRYNAQYILVTHSPILMSIPGSDFLWIGEGAIKKMDYKSSPHFSISKMFFDSPERMVGMVLED